MDVPEPKPFLMGVVSAECALPMQQALHECPPFVSQSATRGEKIVKENQLKLL